MEVWYCMLVVLSVIILGMNDPMRDHLQGLRECEII